MDDMKHFMAGYFHEDWKAEYSSWEQAVDDFMQGSPERAPYIPDRIDQLLQADDQQLRANLRRFGCAHLPPEGDRAWLLAVRDRIQAALDSTS